MHACLLLANNWIRVDMTTIGSAGVADDMLLEFADRDENAKNDFWSIWKDSNKWNSNFYEWNINASFHAVFMQTKPRKYEIGWICYAVDRKQRVNISNPQTNSLTGFLRMNTIYGLQWGMFLLFLLFRWGQQQNLLLVYTNFIVQMLIFVWK